VTSPRGSARFPCMLAQCRRFHCLARVSPARWNASRKVRVGTPKSAAETPAFSVDGGNHARDAVIMAFV